jgi:cytochrome c oxidase cbb3-type subunit 3
MSKETKQTVQTTGHAWDGDLQEFNNPLPNWWLWGFYATVVFAIIYWVLYPAFPIGDTFTKGAMNDVTYKTSDGKETTTHWNTRALLMQEMQQAREMQKPYLDKIQKASYAEIASDQDMRAFAYSSAKVLFADNCAACHQSGGAGVIGLYPNLADDSWLWGGKFDQIHTTITNGRNGAMPSFKGRFSDAQITDLASYVLSFSHQEGVNPAAAKRGQALFEGQAGCFACHTKAGTGNHSMGSANLTDQIWTMANVPGQNNIEGKLMAVKNVISSGINRHMPAWKGRLSEAEIKMLTFYIHELGGGK